MGTLHVLFDTPPCRPCPFCGATTRGERCPACNQDVTAPRRPCPKCGHLTPSRQRECVHCHTVAKSDLRWKIPLIVAIFVVAFVLAILLQLAR